MTFDLSVKQESIVVKEFVLYDNNVSLPAGELMSTLLLLVDAQKPLANIHTSPNVEKYLVDHDYMSITADGMYDLTNTQRVKCKEFGDKVSNMIEAEIAALPVGAVVNIPTLFCVNSSGALDAVSE